MHSGYFHNLSETSIFWHCISFGMYVELRKFDPLYHDAMYAQLRRFEPTWFGLSG